MDGLRILIVSSETSTVERFRSSLGPLAALEILAVAEFEASLTALRAGALDGIVVHVGAGRSSGDVARLLGAGSPWRRPVPVLALSDDYNIEEATSLFRLGVSDYVSLPDHAASLAGLVVQLFRTVPEPPRAGTTAQGSEGTARTRRWRGNAPVI